MQAAPCCRRLWTALTCYLMGLVCLGLLIYCEAQAGAFWAMPSLAYSEHGLGVGSARQLEPGATVPTMGSQATPAGTVRLYGYITDLEGSPVPGTLVGLQDENYAPLTDTVTTSSGYYEFLIPWHSVYRVSVSVWTGNGGYMLLMYIPTVVDVSPGGASGVRTDVALRPGGNLIVNAYDATGNLIRNAAFVTKTNNHAYVSNLEDLPEYGIYFGIHDAYSESYGWSWDLAVPTFVVPTDTHARLHILWEIPDFGQVILDVDNEGRGYTVTQQGGYRILSFNHEAAKSELASLRRDYDSFIAAGYAISPALLGEIHSSQDHLLAAEDYLAQMPPAMALAVSELNQALKVALWAHEELYLEKARVDVEQNRKGSVRLHVVNGQGQPVAGANVVFSQTKRDFLFGANPMGKWNQYDPRYATLLRQAGINYSYIIVAWGAVEPSPGQFDWGTIDNYQNIQAQSSQQFGLMGGLALWCYRGSGLGYGFCPQYLDTMTFPEMQANAYEHMRALAERYRGQIDLWEFNEQNNAWSNPLNLTWDQKIELLRSAIAGLRQGDPAARILFDAGALPYEFNAAKLESTAVLAKGIAYPEFLSLLATRGITVDTIGLEFYYSGVSTDGYAPPGLSLVSLSRLLDQYSAFDKPTFVRELSAPSAQYAGSTWWHRPWDPATQAEFLDKFYTIAFSKPTVREIAWSYGVADEDTAIQSGGLFDASLNPKPAYYALQSLASSWTTNGTGQIDASGNFLLRGFAGEYGVAITAAGGQTWRTQLHVYEQQQTDVTVTLHSAYLPAVNRSVEPVP